LKKEQAKQMKVSPSYQFTEIYARLGDKDQAFGWLEKAYEDRRPMVADLHIDPCWDFLRADPHYVDLVRRIDLEP
jgi:hypothetical protein